MCCTKEVVAWIVDVHFAVDLLNLMFFIGFGDLADYSILGFGEGFVIDCGNIASCIVQLWYCW